MKILRCMKIKVRLPTLDEVVFGALVVVVFLAALTEFARWLSVVP